MFHIDQDHRRKVPQMFGKTPESAEEDVKIIKEWLKTQPHLPEIMEDAKIRNFLTMNKYSIERTKPKIDMYYTIRSVIPDMFEDSNPKSNRMKDFMKTTYCCTHPKTVEGLYRVSFFKLHEPNKFGPQEALMQFYNIMEMRLYEDCTVGDVVVFDLGDLTLSDLKKCTPTLIAKSFAMYEKVYSNRLKTAYYVNSPSYVEIILKIIKTVLKPKIFNRIQVHQDAEVVKELFSKEDLPKDYGGNGPSLQDLNDMIQGKFDEYRNRFEELDTMRVDESLRPEKLNNDEILGFYGNFKKLNVD